MPIIVVIMGTPSATSPWAAVGLATITISVTACFRSTMRAVVIRCANGTAVIGAKGDIIGNVTDKMTTHATVMITGAKAGLRIVVMTDVTAGEVQMANGAAGVDVELV